MTEFWVFRRRLALKTPFRIAHGTYAYRENLFLRIRRDGFEGMGEAPIVPYYGLSIDDAEAELRAGLSAALLDEALGALPGSALADGAAGRGDGGAPAAPPGIRSPFAHPVCAAAFEGSALALKAAMDGTSQAAVLGLRGEAAPESSYTIAFDDHRDAMAAAAEGAFAAGFRHLKVKAGMAGDIEGIAAIRERLPGAVIRVDANQGWSPGEAPSKLAALERLGVELVEEPVSGTPAELERLARGTALPLVLDESVRSEEDLARYAAGAPGLAGIVVKVAKNGGPAASLALMRRALDSGLRLMVSSMVESSLGAASALALAPLCEWCDLDAPLLLSDDPFVGLSYPEGRPVLVGGIVPGPELTAMLDGLEPVLAEA